MEVDANPLYPIYIPTKGRYMYNHTAKALDRMGTPYFLVVEEQEYESYAKAVDKSKILVLDKSYQRDYDTCDDLGDSKSKGSGPARNFALEHAKSNGYQRYWCVDDNIYRFGYYTNNEFNTCANGKFFRYQEEFVLRYKNIAMSGPQYLSFIAGKQKYPAYLLNSRIFSCNLIRTDLKFRWRGRYNEDAILSLDMLSSGWCTVLFYAFYQVKMGTQTLPGGNTDELYKNGTYDKSRMLVEQYPSIAKLAWRYGRVHHKVDWSQFNQGLIKADDYDERVKKSMPLELVPNTNGEKW